jgi:hypothetical protein
MTTTTSKVVDDGRVQSHRFVMGRGEAGFMLMVGLGLSNG